MINKLLLTLAFVNIAAGACTSIGSNRYYCPSTGNAVADGATIQAFLSNATNYSCGATLIVSAGAIYTMPAGNSPGITPQPQTGCTSTSWTNITSDKAENLPSGKYPFSPYTSPSKLVEMKSYMARFDTLSAYPIVAFEPYANNYKFTGIMFTQAASMPTSGSPAIGLTTPRFISNNYPSTGPAGLTYRPSNIWFDRCLMFPIEEELYGSAVLSNTDGRAFSRGVDNPISLDATNLIIQDTYIYGIGSFRKKANDNNATVAGVTVTAATNANPAQITATGIAAIMSNFAHTPRTPARCNATDFGAGRCVLSLIEGATGSWAVINGPVVVEYVDADHVNLYKVDRLLIAAAPNAIDSTGFGPLTGTIKVYNANDAPPFYAWHQDHGSARLIGNFLDGTGMIAFSGGEDPPAYDPAQVISSTGCAVLNTCQVALSHVRGLSVGDYVVLDASTPTLISTYCNQAPPYAIGRICDPTRRVGSVTAIVGNTVMLAAQGPQGIDVAPYVYPTPGITRSREIDPGVRGYAAWRGGEMQLEFRRNWLHKNPEMPGTGKGFTEIKWCKNCLHDGNFMGPGYFGQPFFTTHSQDGHCPWCTATNAVFSNYLIGGPDGAHGRLTLAAGDQVNSAKQGSNVRFENLLAPNVTHPGDGVYSLKLFAMVGVNNNSGYSHFTMPVYTHPTDYNIGGTGDCAYLPNTGYMGNATDSFIRDSVFGSNGGFNSQPNASPFPDCFPGSSAANNTKIHHNVVIDYNTVGYGSSAWPGVGNVIKPDNSFFVGTCSYATWDQCEISAASGLKGTASDGKDPGADVPEIKDHLNGWSEDAGLQTFSLALPGTVNNPAAFLVGSTRMALKFALLGGGIASCAFELYTDPARISLHSDTAGQGKKSCSRSGNIYAEGIVSFVLGTQAALTPSTNYYYRLTDGGRVMVGGFQTASLSADDTVFAVQLSDPDAVTLVVEHSPSPDFSAPVFTSVAFENQLAIATFKVPKGQVEYYRWIKLAIDGIVLDTGPITVAVTP